MVVGQGNRTSRWRRAAAKFCRAKKVARSLRPRSGPSALARRASRSTSCQSPPHRVEKSAPPSREASGGFRQNPPSQWTGSTSPCPSINPPAAANPPASNELQAAARTHARCGRRPPNQNPVVAGPAGYAGRGKPMCLPHPLRTQQMPQYSLLHAVLRDPLAESTISDNHRQNRNPLDWSCGKRFAELSGKGG